MVICTGYSICQSVNLNKYVMCSNIRHVLILWALRWRVINPQVKIQTTEQSIEQILINFLMQLNKGLLQSLTFLMPVTHLQYEANTSLLLLLWTYVWQQILQYSRISTILSLLSLDVNYVTITMEIYCTAATYFVFVKKHWTWKTHIAIWPVRCNTPSAIASNIFWWSKCAKHCTCPTLPLLHSVTGH